MARCLQKIAYSIIAWTCLCYSFFQLFKWPQVNDYDTEPVNSRLLLMDAPDSTPTAPRIDPPGNPAEEEMAIFLQQKIPNVPFEIWMREKSRNHSDSHKCAYYPNILDVQFNNIYWQTVRTSNGSFFLYGAYYDNRVLNSLGATIRILGMIDRIEPTVKTYCQLWFDPAKDPVVTPVVEYKYAWYKKWGSYKQGVLQPYLLACIIPEAYNNSVPVSVSVTEKGCEPPTNNLRVNNERPSSKKRFAVCVKGLDFLHSDLSVRLVEWIELLDILGADKIFLYELEVHPNISRVLSYYQETGKVVVTPITLPGGQPNIPGFRHVYLRSRVTRKRQNELIPYNDCLYRNLYSYNYLALLDTDEIIIPKKVETWSQLMDSVLANFSAEPDYFPRDSFNFRNVYFWDNENHSHHWEPGIPDYMYMLQHFYRSANYTKPRQYVKCFHNVERVLMLHNHFPLACLSGKCKSFPVHTDDAHLQHYRADCVSSLKKKCESDYKQHTVNDTAIWSYKEQLVPRVNDVLEKLGYLPSKIFKHA